MDSALFRTPLLLVTCLFSTAAQGQLEVMGHLPYAPLTLAGCWHYVDSFGNEYALVGTSQGLSIVDVSDPKTPTERFAVPGPPNNWREVKTWNGFAYVGSEANNSGITIVDLRRLPDTVQWRVWFGPGSDKIVLRSHTIACADGYLYIFGGTQQGVVICDLSDPWEPQVESIIPSPYVHDGYIRNDTLWTSEIYAGEFGVYDISDKKNPCRLASHPTPAAFNHNTELSDDSRYLFTTDERWNAPLASFDVTNLENVRLLDKYFPSVRPTAEVHNVRVRSGYLVNPSYGGQLTIVDAHRPDNLIEVAHILLGNSLVWDASPYLPSGNIIASVRNEGLFVLKPNYTRAAYVEGRVTDAATGRPLGGVKVMVRGTANTDISRPDGTFKTGAGAPGKYEIIFGKVGYQSKVLSDVALYRGETTLVEVALERF